MESLMIEMKSISLCLFPKNKLRRKITLMKLALTVLSCTPATFGCLADGIIFHEAFESPNSVCFSGDGTIDAADGYKTPGALRVVDDSKATVCQAVSKPILRLADTFSTS